MPGVGDADADDMCGQAVSCAAEMGLPVGARAAAKDATSGPLPMDATATGAGMAKASLLLAPAAAGAAGWGASAAAALPPLKDAAAGAAGAACSERAERSGWL